MLNRAVVGTLLTDNVSLETKVNWLASVRGRLGYASITGYSMPPAALLSPTST